MNSNLVSDNDLEGRHKKEWENLKQPKQVIDASGESYKSLYEKLGDRKRNHTESYKPKNTTKSASDKIEFCDQKISERFNDRNQKQDLIDYKNIYDERNQSWRIKNEKGYDAATQNHLDKACAEKTDPELSNGRIDSNVHKNNGEQMHDCWNKRKQCEADSFHKKFLGSGLACIGVLPGFGTFIDSSDDSDQSSSGSEGNENAKYDLLGRRIVFEE